MNVYALIELNVVLEKFRKPVTFSVRRSKPLVSGKAVLALKSSLIRLNQSTSLLRASIPKRSGKNTLSGDVRRADIS